MQTSSRSHFLTIHTEGALLPVDLLQRILAGDKSIPGLAPDDYHLSGEKVNEAINRAWNHLQGSWAAFQTSRGRLKEGDPGTTLTRERWLLPLFQELGYGRLQTAKAIEIEGGGKEHRSYAISHTWGAQELPTPIHLVGCGVDIEKRQTDGRGESETRRSKSSPHSLMQELLNRDDTRHWGLVSNGLRLRLLRDNASLTRQAFLEFDLEAMFSGEIYADFAVLWLVCHQSRLEGDKPEAQWLERWSKVAQEQGTRALDSLRGGVEEAIIALGQGFLAHPANQALRQQLKSGALDRQQYFRQLLRLVYRLIFLFVAEDRDLLLLPDAAPAVRERYLKFYSTARLRRLAERNRGGRHPDLWQGLKLLTDLLAGNLPGGKEIGLPVLGGFLFSHKALPDLENAQVDNQALLNAVRSLAFTQEKSARRAVDYKNLGSEELGSVYESLLELQPVLNVDASAFELKAVAGNERKTTGSYYTNAGLIKITLDSALDPVIEQAILRAGNDVQAQMAALLALKVCDPASGSGHFLIAAARRIAKRLAQLRSGDEEPSPAMIRHALREVIAHCIYGVDINPMAVELCKVNLWLEALEPGKPLTFLDAHIKYGNSLVGVGPGMDVYDLVIPDEAFDPVTGDDKKVASALKKRNKKEREGQLTFDLHGAREEPVEDYAARLRQIEVMPEENAGQVAVKEAAYAALQSETLVMHRRQLADLWTAAFFWRLRADASGALAAPTQGEWRNARLGKPSLELSAEARRLAVEIDFFHWTLEFSNVFEQGGFDCALGNPPWERIKLQEEEFFAQRDPEIANAPNKAAREKMINALIHSNPALATIFDDSKHVAEAISKFVRVSKRFPFTGVGDVNTYALFTEHSRNLLSKLGKAGIIVPTGIATDDTLKEFFQNLTTTNSLKSLIGFENEEFLFSGIANVVRFCNLTLQAPSEEENQAVYFVFYLRQVNQIHQRDRFFSLTTTDLALFNPNTFTCPIFRNRFDAELTKSIYKRFPVLLNEGTEENYWGVRYLRMIDMANDSGLFQNNPGEGLLPLYEAKFFWHFDHRFGSYGIEGPGRGGRGLAEMPLSNYLNPNFSIIPRYWLDKKIVEQRLLGWDFGWLIGFRDVTSAKLERSAVFSFLPRVAIGHKAPLIFLDKSPSVSLTACFLANANSIVFDFITRQKIGGTSLSYFILNQLPILPPDTYTSADIAYIAPRVLELVYTSFDLKSLSEDMGYHGKPFRWNEERRALLRAELDAYYAKLYGLARDELRYILDPQDVYGPDFPGETFRVLKEKEIKQFGEYRTRRLVLEAWDRLEAEDVQVGSGEQRVVDGGQPARVVREEKTALHISSALVVEVPEPKPTPVAKASPKTETPSNQPSLGSDFGLYKCGVCGKLVMGYEKDEHEHKAHRAKGVEWKKIR